MATNVFEGKTGAGVHFVFTPAKTATRTGEDALAVSGGTSSFAATPRFASITSRKSEAVSITGWARHYTDRNRRSWRRGTGHCRRITGGMPDVMNDNFVVTNFVEHQIRIRRHNQTADSWIVRAPAHQGVGRQKIDEGFNPGLDADRASWRARREVIKKFVKIGERRKGVADLHRPCFAQTART